MPEASLSHNLVSVQNALQRNHKRVHFAPTTTDIITTLSSRAEFSFSTSCNREQRHCRPILKYSENMTAYIRRAGTSFAKALSALGTWCAGVTSENPNVRSDMYKQLVAQIRGVSPHLRQAGESVLCQNVHGMWVQLVEDFAIRREQYTPQDVELFENAAQVIGIIFSNHRFLERLDVLDVQTLVLEIITRVDLHIDSKLLPDRRFQSHIWLLGCEVSGWWESQSTLYSEALCTRLYNIVSRINILSSTPPVQKSLLEIFKLVFVRYPNLKAIDVCSFLDLAWTYIPSVMDVVDRSFMWHEDEGVKRAARNVVTLIADHRGGHLDIYQVVKLKCRTPRLFQYEIISKVEDELRILPADGLELWMIITRLLKENIVNLAQDRLKIWLIIPQERLWYKVSGKMAGIMISYLVHYCHNYIEQSQNTYDAFAFPFKSKRRSPGTALKALDICLNSFYWNSPLQEPIPLDRSKQRPNLKLWAKVSVDALLFERLFLTTNELKEETDILIGHLFCHWDNLLRAMVNIQSFPDYDEEKKMQDIMDLCDIFGKSFAERIQDEFNALGNCGKHAVHVFWYNLMAMILALDKNKDSVFPVEILRSLLPLILGGLRSTQVRIRQHTYRFVTHGPILGGIRWLVEKDSLELLKAIHIAREEFESATFDWYGTPVTQVDDFAILVSQLVEMGGTHLMSLKPLVMEGSSEVRWVWLDPDGKEFELGQEEVFTDEELEKLKKIKEGRAKREGKRLKRKAEKEAGNPKKPRRVYDIKELTALVKSRGMRLGLPEDSRKVMKEIPLDRPPKLPVEQLPTHNERLETDEPPLPPISNPASTMSQSNRNPPVNTVPGSQQLESPIAPTNNTPACSAAPVHSSLSSQPLPTSQSSPPRSSPPTSYDKRMPPPPVNWRSSSQNTSKLAQETTATSPPKRPSSSSKTDRSPEVSMDKVIDEMVQKAQQSDAPVAMGSMVTGKRNQLEAFGCDETVNAETLKIINCYLREGDDRIGILPEGWKEVEDAPTDTEAPRASRKRSRDETRPSTETSSEKRELKSDYCPATHTTWKPAWLETTQCYPVDQDGQDMSDIDSLKGDGIHRNADKLKRVLEIECMYIPNHRIDEMIAIAEDTVQALKRTKQFYNEHPNKKIRIERHQFEE